MGASNVSSPDQNHSIAAELVAVLVAATAGQPRVLTIDDGRALPSGPFQMSDRSLQGGLRSWVEHQTHHPLGYVEQLYTFADRDRVGGMPMISISYLGLMREGGTSGDQAPAWCDWYEYFPWEDRRATSLSSTDTHPDSLPNRLMDWARQAQGAEQAERQQRIAITFGTQGHRWNEEFTLQRYELLYEARLVPEATGIPCTATGKAMSHDHRRILATAIARLRAKIKYRPVVFELMPPSFTLLQLQRSVEAVAGRAIHKQNFRRLMEQQELVEETGEITAATGGRPAKLFRFRREILAERAVAGTKPSVPRA